MLTSDTSYENWAQCVGGVLKHAGFEGFLGNRDQLASTRNASDDQLRVFCDMLAEYPNGTKFRAASETGKAISLLDVLNEGCEATGFKPLLIRGWGYNQDAQRFLSGGTLGGKLKQFSKKPHMATNSEGEEIEIKLVAHEDNKTKSTYYVLQKSD